MLIYFLIAAGLLVVGVGLLVGSLILYASKMMDYLEEEDGP